MFASAHAALSGNGVGGNVFTIGFALLLGAQNFELGLLVAIPQLALLAQAHAAMLTRRVPSRRALVVAACSISRYSVALWPLFAIFLGDSALHVFLGIWAIANVAGSYAGNAWMSWMADLVPRPVRGRYFSVRNNFANAIGLALSVGMGFLLDWWAGARPGADPASDGRRLMGFTAIFLLAVVAGHISIVLLGRQAEPPRMADGPRPGLAPERLRDALKAPFRDRAFRRLLLFYGVFWAANGLGNPFWTPYVIQELGRSYGLVTVLGLIGGLSSFLALPVWGRLQDRFGSKPLMVATVFVSATHPLYWLWARPDFIAPIFLDAVSAGVVWGGFNLALFNLLLASAPRGPGREMYYAAFNGLGGLAMAITSTLAGSVAAAIPPAALLGLDLNQRQVIFAAVTILRLGALALLLRVREPGRDERRAFHRAVTRSSAFDARKRLPASSSVRRLT